MVDCKQYSLGDCTSNGARSLIVGASRVDQGQPEAFVQFYDLEEWIVPKTEPKMLALDLEPFSRLLSYILISTPL